MPKVMLEMKMPKSCLDCHLGPYMDCALKTNAIFYGFANTKRHDNCPLKECK